MTPVLHPPYSPDLTLNNIFLFPWMNKVLKGKRFASVEEVKQNNNRSTKRHQNQAVQNCFEQWKKVLIGVMHQREGTLR